MENDNEINRQNSNKNNRQVLKILLMGKAGVGKSSMRSIIFANQAPKDTFLLGYTADVAESRLRFMGNLTFHLFDCGGQEEFIRHYFDSKKETIFSGVAALIFVVEAEGDKKNEEDNLSDLDVFSDCLSALEKFSPNTNVFVLVNKIDTIPEDNREEVFKKRVSELSSRKGKFDIEFFQTSIWENSLYKAWASITRRLTRNVKEIEEGLKTFALANDAEEVILFERNSLLAVAHYNRRGNIEEDRFERISHIIKKFKLSCINAAEKSFKSMTLGSDVFLSVLEEFTESTCLMVTLVNSKTDLALLRLNISLARGKFKEKMGEVSE